MGPISRSTAARDGPTSSPSWGMSKYLRAVENHRTPHLFQAYGRGFRVIPRSRLHGLGVGVGSTRSVCGLVDRMMGLRGAWLKLKSATRFPRIGTSSRTSG